MERRGTTLIEMLTVVGIIMLLLGGGLASMMVIIRRNSPDSGPNIVRAVHMAMSSLAQQHNRSGRIYGYTLIYSSATVGTQTVQVATRLVPWYYEGNGTSVPFTASVGDPNQLIPLNLACELGSYASLNNRYQYDLTDVEMTASVELNGAPQTSSTYLHVAFEPGTGFVHGSAPTTDPLASNSFSATSSALLTDLRKAKPDLMELTFLSMKTANSVRLLRLYPNGSAEFLGPQ